MTPSKENTHLNSLSAAAAASLPSAASLSSSASSSSPSSSSAEKKPLSILALIPAYNEELAIGSVVLLSRKYADAVIVLDDGSTDNTAE
ncbi:MAG TPA: hypothetical protein O0X42_05220, partial [Methanocorpusculum sp.]|nr:hypothetical protein [Methanocorpusculum sp.]